MKNARIIKDLSNDDYHSNPAISRSGLIKMGCPRKYWWEHLSGEFENVETKAFRIGTAFHTMILEPENFNKTSVVLPENAPKKPTTSQINAKNPSDSTLLQIEWWDDFTSKYEDKSILCQKEYNGLKAMSQVIREEPSVKKLITSKGIIESSIFYTENEIDYKVRPDFMWENYKIVVDLKSVASAAPDEFQRSITKYGYDVQAYMICRAVEKLTGEKPEEFIFLCQEKKEPYCVAAYNADDMVLESGRRKYETYSEIYKACKASGDWPSYSNFIRPISIPPWEIKRMDDTQNN